MLVKIESRARMWGPNMFSCHNPRSECSYKVNKREDEHMNAGGRVQERASPHMMPRGQWPVRLGLKNLSTSVVCTLHTRMLLGNDPLLAGMLAGKYVRTPSSIFGHYL
jgi:hypothetical protein